MDYLLPKKSIRVNAVWQNDVNFRNHLNSFDDISSLKLLRENRNIIEVL